MLSYAVRLSHLVNIVLGKRDAELLRKLFLNLRITDEETGQLRMLTDDEYKRLHDLAVLFILEQPQLNRLNKVRAAGTFDKNYLHNWLVDQKIYGRPIDRLNVDTFSCDFYDLGGLVEFVLALPRCDLQVAMELFRTRRSREALNIVPSRTLAELAA